MTIQSEDAFEAILEYLYSFINFEHNRLDRYLANKLDATRARRLMAALGDPHERFPAIHIAGTKGKGSVAAMCAAALRAAGLKVGLYTSPHMIDFRERVRVLTPDDANGMVSKADFVQLMRRIQAVETAVPGITWFEIITAVAFQHFANERVDVAVVEVGLGGRLDATNVLTPLVSVITSLSMDHTYFLGDTIEAIAYEKGGIIKPGIPVVTAPQQPGALARLTQIAAERQAPLTVVGRDLTVESLAHGPHGQRIRVAQQPQPGPVWEVPVALAGSHQQQNAAVALAALLQVQPRFPSLTPDAIAAGMANVSWPGRLQILHEGPDGPLVLADCAHNEDSAQKLAQALQAEYAYRRLVLVFGVSIDKAVGDMMQQLFPLADELYGTRSSHPRAMPEDELVALAADFGFQMLPAVDVETAVAAAWAGASPADLICVTGSIFVVGDLLSRWDGLQSRLMREAQTQ